MKRIIVFLFVILTSNGWLLANYWTPDGASFEDNMTLTGIVQINGVEQQSQTLEVGAFCGTECRGSGIVAYFPPTQRYVIQMLIFGENGDQLTFKLFDHSLNQELDLVSPEAIIFTANGYGNLTDPYVLNFTGACVVTATANPAEGGIITGAGAYPQGATAILVATANEGYTFVNWTKGGVVVSTGPTYSFTVTEAASYVANFSDNYWTPNSTPYEDNMTLTAVVKINDVEQQTTALEVGVFCGEECRGAGRLALFPPTQHYVVQLLIYGSSGDELIFKLFNHEQNAELDLVSPEAIIFTENGYGSLTNPYVLNFLEVHEVTVTANPSDGGTADGAGTYIHGTTATLTATANTGYHFLNWTMGGEVVSSEASYSFTVTGDNEYMANFELNSYEITTIANPTDGGTVTGADTYNHFDTCTLMAAANEGYTFINWTKGGEEVTTSTTYSFTVTEAGDYVANFELNTYEVNATANPEVGGSVNGAGTYDHGATATLTATANEGYTFVNWMKDGTVVCTNVSYSFTVTEAATFVANFVLNSYAITATANPTEGGTVTGTGTYDHGTTATLTATPNEGYTFTNWTKNGTVVSTNASYSLTVTEAADFMANFTLNSYEITATANPEVGGSVNGAGTYDHGTTATLTATPDEGYTFVNWTKDNEVVSTNATYSFTVTEAAAYVANFTLNNYEITAIANPEVAGSVDGAGAYDHGTTATLTASPNEGYTFVSWSKDGTVVSTNACYSFTVTEATAFVANFESTSSDITQTSTFNNGWTWWSTCIETSEADVLDQLKTGLGASGQVIKSQTASTMHLGNNWVGSLSMTNENGYMVKSNGEVTVDITGPATTPENHPISLNSGWTWIGYPCTETMTVAEALANHTPQPNDVIKGQNASAMFMMGQWRGALTLTPGIGLMYKSNSNAPVTLTYATPSKSGEAEAYAIETHWNANHNAYPTNMTVLAVVELDGKELAHRQAQGPDANYELAAFANGECRGSVAMMYVETLDRYMALLTISGEESDIFHFALYNTEMSEECFNADETLTYETDAVIGNPDEPFVIRFRSTTGVDEWANSLQVFPNPVEHGQTISFGMTNDMGEVQVEIINALGAVVEMQRTTSLQTLTAPKVAGVYTLKITVEGKGTCYRKLVVR